MIKGFTRIWVDHDEFPPSCTHTLFLVSQPWLDLDNQLYSVYLTLVIAFLIPVIGGGQSSLARTTVGKEVLTLILDLTQSHQST